MKRIFCILLSAAAVICFSSCGKDADSHKSKSHNTQQEEHDDSTSNPLSNIKDSTKGNSKKESDKSEKTISLNQTVTIGDVMELTLESTEWSEEINPSNTGSTYSYYQDVSGEKYFVIRGKAKNLTGEDIDISYINDSQILINDTYKASINIDSEETDGSSFFGSIKPLQTLNIVAYASVSDEVYKICNNIKLTLNIVSNSEYVNYFYDEENPHETYSIEFK